MRSFLSLFVFCSFAFYAQAEKRSHNHGPEYLDQCWDKGDGHVYNPFCDWLTRTTSTTTTTTTTTPTTTTTTTEPTTTTTEPTTTTTEPTTTTTVPTTTTTTPAPTTTARHCEFEVHNDSSIKDTDFGTDTHVVSNANVTQNTSVHLLQDIAYCQSVCANSVANEGYECWGFTYSETDRCYLYYYSRRLGYIKAPQINSTGTILYLKRCSDDVFSRSSSVTPSRTTPTAPVTKVTTAPTPVQTESSTSQQTVVTDTVSTASTQSIRTPPPIVSTDTTAGSVITTSTSVSTASTGTTAGPVSTASTAGSTASTGTPAVVVTTGTTAGQVVTSSTTGPVITDTTIGQSVTSGSSAGVVTVGSTAGAAGTRTTTGGGLTGSTSGNVVTTGATAAPGPSTQVIGGRVIISTNKYQINGVPSPVQDTCYFVNTTFAKGAHWNETCRYDCECTDPSNNIALCTDMCPHYTSIAPNCQVVKRQGECCADLECTTGVTIVTTGPDTCRDLNDTCDLVPDSGCMGIFVPWATAHCALRCDMCPGQAPPCYDRISFCDMYDLANACKSYPIWANQNCRSSCNLCRPPGWNPDGKNVASTTPAVVTTP